MSDPLPAPAEQMTLFQAIRVLERRARAEGRAGRLGETAHPGQEPVRLGARPGTGFAAGEVAELRPAIEPGMAPKLVITPIGLTGPMGTLPQAYTDMVSERLRAREPALAAFLDLFNHRVAALFYRAWAKYRLAVAYERSEGDDPISLTLLALIGHGTPGLRDRAPVPDAVLVHYGGLFARRVRHADGLGALLGDHFGRPIGVQQFVGRWLWLAAGEFTRLGAANARLGRDTVAGPRIWDVQGMFRLSVGPLSYDEFQDFMPGGTALARLGALARLYVGPGLGFDVEVVLRRDEVPGVRLGAAGPAAPRLGWNAWLATEPMRADPRDAVFRVPEQQDAIA